MAKSGVGTVLKTPGAWAAHTPGQITTLEAESHGSRLFLTILIPFQGKMGENYNKALKNHTSVSTRSKKYDPSFKTPSPNSQPEAAPGLFSAFLTSILSFLCRQNGKGARPARHAAGRRQGGLVTGVTLFGARVCTWPSAWGPPPAATLPGFSKRLARIFHLCVNSWCLQLGGGHARLPCCLLV